MPETADAIVIEPGVIGAGFYSRLRESNPESSFSMLG